MTKKKANTREIAAKRKADIKLLDERFLERVTIIGRALIGDTFELIPPQILRHMAFCRAPRLKAKAEEGSYIPKEIVIKYNKLLLEFIKEDTIESYSGVEIPLDWYLSEGLMLVNYFHQLDDDLFPEEATIKEAFKEYFHGSVHHNWIGEILAEKVVDVSVFLSHFGQYIYQADLQHTVYSDTYTPYNTVYIRRLRLNSTHVTIDNHRRPIIKVGWQFGNGEWENNMIKPSQIGFEGTGDNIPNPVYIQEHALRKLQERIDITPGIMHYALAALFTPEWISYIKYNNNHLVPFDLASGKIGYLLCRWCERKIIITTFLFLTNDGTPEGKKLEELTMLRKMDKQHLQIDTVQHFLSYHIDRNEELKSLFIEAGCGL
jgi:hypothetical protein